MKARRSRARDETLRPADLASLIGSRPRVRLPSTTRIARRRAADKGHGSHHVPWCDASRDRGRESEAVRKTRLNASTSGQVRLSTCSRATSDVRGCGRSEGGSSGEEGGSVRYREVEFDTLESSVSNTRSRRRTPGAQSGTRDGADPPRRYTRRRAGVSHTSCNKRISLV